MDQLDRGLRQRLTEETVRHRLAVTDSQRDRARLFGYVDDDRASRRALLIVVSIALVTTLVVVLYLGFGRPSVERPAMADEPTWGSATQESTRVRPPAWWPIEP